MFFFKLDAVHYIFMFESFKKRVFLFEISLQTKKNIYKNYSVKLIQNSEENIVRIKQIFVHLNRV